jgi:hypothetical protein
MLDMILDGTNSDKRSQMVLFESLLITYEASTNFEAAEEVKKPKN